MGQAVSAGSPDRPLRRFSFVVIGESPTAPEVAMQYALMIYAEPGYDEALSDAEREAVRAEYPALADDARCVGGARAAAGRDGDLRARGRRPDADDRRPVRGHQGGARRVRLVEAANLDEAIELAARIPAARLGGVVEVRPVVPR